MINFKSLGYEDITKENPIHFIECFGETFSTTYPYEQRFRKEEPSIPEIVDEHYWEMLGEEPVREVWHDASKEPNDMSHCLIFYGDKNDVGHYLHYEPVLYNHQEKVFVTESFPHPTGYKVEQKSIDGGCVAEVYKNKRDRISISDITSWCYLNDLHNLTQKEEPVSEDLEEAAKLHVIETRGEDIVWDENARCAMLDFKAGAKWKKEQMMKDDGQILQRPQH